MTKRRSTTINLAFLAVVLMTASGCRFGLPQLSDVLLPRVHLAEHHPRNPHALFIEGKGYLTQGKPQKAAACFRGALREQPGFVEARLGLAHALRQKKSYRRACREYQRVLGQIPDNGQALEGLAIAQSRLGRNDEAEQTFRRALALSPEAVSLLNAVADFYYGREEYGKALEYWDKSLRIAGGQSEIRALAEDLRAYVKKYGPTPPRKNGSPTDPPA